MKRIIAFAITLILAAIFSAFADDELVPCPVCGAAVKYHCYDCGAIFGGKEQRLDGKQPGVDYRYSVCPKCGLVLIAKNGFQLQAGPEMKVVLSPYYAELPKNYPGHYYLAKIYERLDRHAKIIGYTYLKASFEAESSHPHLVAEMLKNALDYYKKALPLEKEEGEGFGYLLLTIGEIQRRLGLFDDARATFSRVPLNRLNRSQFSYELALIEKKDTASHGRNEMEEK